MEKRVINSFGTLTLPKHIREEFGILGTTSTVMVDLREGQGGVKEVVIRKEDNLEEVLLRYKSLAEIISRVAECTVSVVWNNLVLSMSSNISTDTFVGKGIYISKELSNRLKGKDDHSILNDKENVPFLLSNMGKVLAYYKIPDTGDDRGHFVLLNGTKLDSGVTLSKADAQRRYEIIQDIIKIGV